MRNFRLPSKKPPVGGLLSDYVNLSVPIHASSTVPIPGLQSRAPDFARACRRMDPFSSIRPARRLALLMLTAELKKNAAICLPLQRLRSQFRDAQPGGRDAGLSGLRRNPSHSPICTDRQTSFGRRGWRGLSGDGGRGSLRVMSGDGRSVLEASRDTPFAPPLLSTGAIFIHPPRRQRVSLMEKTRFGRPAQLTWAAGA